MQKAIKRDSLLFKGARSAPCCVHARARARETPAQPPSQDPAAGPAPAAEVLANGKFIGSSASLARLSSSSPARREERRLEARRRRLQSRSRAGALLGSHLPFSLALQGSISLGSQLPRPLRISFLECFAAAVLCRIRKLRNLFAGRFRSVRCSPPLFFYLPVQFGHEELQSSPVSPASGPGGVRAAGR